MGKAGQQPCEVRHHFRAVADGRRSPESAGSQPKRNAGAGEHGQRSLYTVPAGISGAMYALVNGSQP